MKAVDLGQHSLPSGAIPVRTKPLSDPRLEERVGSIAIVLRDYPATLDSERLCGVIRGLLGELTDEIVRERDHLRAAEQTRRRRKRRPKSP